MYFNPFSKITNSSEIGLLKYEDLGVLSTIDEGYSIEYKGAFSASVKTEKLPKSVSAFSNSSGGWLFIGVNNSGVVVDAYFDDLEVFCENGYVYIKILFKGLNPGQKMFLPAKLLLKNGIDKIEYSITSKYSMDRTNGKLLKRHI